MSQAFFIDLEKTFDSLDHSQLLRKLYNCGFRGHIFDITNAYLTDRWQYVFDKENSKEKFLLLPAYHKDQYGASFLLIHISAWPGASPTNSKLANISHDTSLFPSGKSYELTFQNDINPINILFACNKLMMNTSKSETI